MEDDQAVRNATRVLLTSEGLHVMASGSIEDALKQVATASRVDVLITDYHLQNGETGTQAIAALREALNLPQLKAILMTGDTSTAIAELRPDLLRRMASKPINAEKLLSLIRGLLATH